jgi:hypothetical protein
MMISRKLYWLLLSSLLLALPNFAHAQCAGGVNAGALTPIASWQTISTLAGRYYTFAATAGNSYQFSYCNGGGAAGIDTEITIQNAAGTPVAGAYNDNACAGGRSEITWACTVTGTYRVYTTLWFCSSSATAITLAYRSIVPVGPGATCASPFVIPSLPFNHTSRTTCGAGNDYNSTMACGSGYMNGEDFVYTYTAPSSQCITLTITGTPGQHGLFVLNGCPSAGGTSCLAKIDSAGGSVLNVTLPSAGTYYIVVDGANPPNSCISYNLNIAQCPSGANCADPRIIPSLPYTAAGLTTCGFANDYTSAHACTSTYMNGQDFVFRYTSPGNECIDVFVSGTLSYTGLFVIYGCPIGGTCIAEEEPIAGSPSLPGTFLAAAGDYYIVVDKLGSPNCTGFTINVDTCQPPVPCGTNPPGADPCSGAPNITAYNPFCGSTDPALYTIDNPGNLNSVFCGVIDNNQWFAFTADSTTETFYLNVGPCLLNMGIQAMIFSAVGCSTFTPVSACFNPGTAVSGSIVASGLTPGQTYYLMIDGQAGDDCDFTVTNTPALPVEWGQLNLTEQDGTALIEWQTWSETNNAGFEVQRGQPYAFGEQGAISWETIGSVDGNLNANGLHNYSFTDRDPVNDREIWYRIRQLDVDGYSNFSEILPWKTVQSRTSLEVYPVPTDEVLHLKFSNALERAAQFSLFDLQGHLVMEQSLEAGLLHSTMDVSSLPEGLYFYRTTANAGRTLSGKIVISR